MSRRTAQIAAVVAVIVLTAAAWQWWHSPSRQIRALLDDVAAAFTHDEPGSGLEALTAVAALQRHLGEDVRLERPGMPVITGRQEAISAAARVRASAPAMRVRFFDPLITLTGDRAARVSVTAEVTTRASSGEDLVDVHQVTATLMKPADRWQVTAARSGRRGEPES